MLGEGFSSLPGLAVSSQDSAPAPPPWLPQMGHVPKKAPREAWGRAGWGRAWVKSREQEML